MNRKDYERLTVDLLDLRLPEQPVNHALALLSPDDLADPTDHPAVLACISAAAFTYSHEQQIMMALAATFDRTVTSAVDLNAGGVVQYLTPALAKGMTLAYHTAYDSFSVVEHRDPAGAGWA
jgi:hypothetical protein